MNDQMTSAVLSSAKIKTEKTPARPGIPFQLKIIRWIFPLVEVIAPRIAYWWFAKLFFSPLRYPLPDAEQAVLMTAERFQVIANTKTVQCYAWGNGPVILFVHGWAGRASQFKSFILPFTEAGYKVMAFDAPAHGLSEGSMTSLFDFKDAMFEIEKRTGKINAVIAHSFGGGAALFATSEGLNANVLITIATPTHAEEIVNEFAERVNGSAKAIASLKKYVQKTFNRSLESFMSSHFLNELKHEIKWLIFHDENDKEVPITNAEKLIEIYPAATFIKTSGLGHNRILKDENVIEKCLQFVKGH